MPVMTLLVFFLVLPSSFHPSLGNPDYTYYGVVPSNIYLYLLNDPLNFTSGWVQGTNGSRTGSPGLDGMTVATNALLAIVASEDGTNVRVYDLADGSLLSQRTINSMEKHLVLLANGTAFKVVSDKQVSVLLLNYQTLPAATATEGPLPYTFYTDVNGLYVGTRFVFMASEQPSVIPTSVYSILALEKSTVTVTDEDGGQNSYSLEVNSYEDVALTPFKVYDIESTGNIMVQSIFLRYDISDPAYGNVPCFPVPCPQGGFVGTFFIARSVISWDANKDFGYRIAAAEDAHVTVYDLETQLVNSEFTVSGGSGHAIKPKVNGIIVQSDKPVSLSLIHNGSIEQLRSILSGVGGEFMGYGHGVMFMGIKPDQDTMIHMPVDANVEAYFFANEATQLIIDGNTQTIQAGTGFLYTVLGTHTVSVDHNVVLQINFWPLEPEYQGLRYTGAIIPCVETVDTNPTVTITTIGGGGLPITYIAIGGGAAAVVVVVAVVVMRKRGSKPS